MGGTAVQVDVLPAQADQLTLAHGGFQRQLHDRQQMRIACLPAGGKQVDLLSCLQAPIPRSVVGWQLDVADRVVNVDAPFLAGHFEHMAEQHQIALDGGR